ncbi:hypothetical protein ACQCSX_03005 [Pseudarthrobacter sp. P1]|uniref:hypothetical protein n=1 Tax=Pseudarthrobacter sp. P1 TaxID=3418418 RepID=UPI003CE73575
MLSGALAIAISALTTWAVGTSWLHKRDPDSSFWYGFAGLCLLAPALLIPTVQRPPDGVLLIALSAAAAGATAAALHRRELRLAHLELAARHDAMVARWARYELDPGRQIDFPAMVDVRVPETAAMIRALAEAELWRRAPVTVRTTGAAGDGYGPAVARLESAVARAEAGAIAALDAPIPVAVGTNGVVPRNSQVPSTQDSSACAL